MDTIRRVVRNLLGTNSRLYKAGATFLNFLSTTRKEGIRTWATLKELTEENQDNGSPRPVILKSLRYPILIRPGTQDAMTVTDNVIREEYGKFTPAKAPEWMIDAGAYIGDTTAYFLSRFPKLKVVALEPNPPSYEMAKHNLKLYGGRAILLQKGLFSTEQVHRFSGGGTGASITNSGFEIDCTTVLSLLERYSIPRVDILKMDIEGAEEAVFLSQPEVWLSHIELLILEIHSTHIKSLISSVLRENGFSMKQYRSIWYCRPDPKRVLPTKVTGPDRNSAAFHSLQFGSKYTTQCNNSRYPSLDLTLH